MKCDLHVHTRFSYDTNSSPKEMVEAAIKNGIDCLAITDHNEVQGALEAEKYATDKSVLIIPGIEVKSRKGDILGLNVRERISSGLPARETIKKIKEKGGIAVIPHPFAWPGHFKGDLKDLIKEIDGVEVLNASIFPSANKKALEFAKRNNLPFTVGSDAHFPNFIGGSYLEVPGENLSIREVLERIRNKNVKLKGKEINLLEGIFDHAKRNIIKLSKAFLYRPC